jgi:hypothetical protein
MLGAPVTTAAQPHACRKEGVVAHADCACHGAAQRADASAAAHRDCCTIEQGSSHDAPALPGAAGSGASHLVAAALPHVYVPAFTPSLRLGARQPRLPARVPLHASNCVYRL